MPQPSRIPTISFVWRRYWVWICIPSHGKDVDGIWQKVKTNLLYLPVSRSKIFNFYQNINYRHLCTNLPSFSSHSISTLVCNGCTTNSIKLKGQLRAPTQGVEVPQPPPCPPPPARTTPSHFSQALSLETRPG